MFYANTHSMNKIDLSLVSEVYGSPIYLNLDIFLIELGVLHIREGGAHFLPLPLSPTKRFTITEWFTSTLVAWSHLLSSFECSPPACLLNRVFIYNLLPMIHRSNMTEEMAYVLRNLRLDLSFVFYLKMIKDAKDNNIKHYIINLVIITQLMKKIGVVFRSNLRKLGGNINEGTLKKMEKNKILKDPVVNLIWVDSCNESTDEEVPALTPSAPVTRPASLS